MSKFNKVLWEQGRKVEDNIRPKINKFLGCDFKRDEDDKFDIIDFHDEDKKVLVEIKGRNVKSTRWEETIITCGKITEGLMKMELGYQVYYFFVFQDKTMYLKLDPDNCDFSMKYTGTNHIPHYMIPVKSLTEFTDEE